MPFWPMSEFMQLLLVCAKVGTLTIGGAASLLPVLRHELVSVHGFLTPEEFMQGMALGEVTPGPAVVGLAIAGIKYAKLPGGALVLVALVLPGLLWMGGVTAAARRLRVIPAVGWFLSGIRLAVPALLIALAWDLAAAWSAPAFLVAGGTLWLTATGRVHPSLLILAAVGVGVLRS